MKTEEKKTSNVPTKPTPAPPKVEVTEEITDKMRLDWLEQQLDNSYIDLRHHPYASQLYGEDVKRFNPLKPFYVNEHAGSSLREAIDGNIKKELGL